MARKQKVNKSKLQQFIWNLTDEQRMNFLADFKVTFQYEDNLSDLLFNTVKGEKWMAERIYAAR